MRLARCTAGPIAPSVVVRLVCTFLTTTSPVWIPTRTPMSASPTSPTSSCMARAARQAHPHDPRAASACRTGLDAVAQHLADDSAVPVHRLLHRLDDRLEFAGGVFGSRPSISAVELRMSANRTEMLLRSPAVERRDTPDAAAVQAVGGSAALTAEPAGRLHEPPQRPHDAAQRRSAISQKRLPAAFAARQALQVRCRSPRFRRLVPGGSVAWRAGGVERRPTSH